MGSKADWETEHRKALEAILRALYGALVRDAAAENSPPSAYGRTVDAVARKGFNLAQLAEYVRIQARIEAVKVTLYAGYPGTPDPVPPAPSSPGNGHTSGPEGEPALGGGRLKDPDGLRADAVHCQQLQAAQRGGLGQ